MVVERGETKIEVAQDRDLAQETGLTTHDEICDLFNEICSMTSKEYGSCTVRTQNWKQENLTPLMMMAKCQFRVADEEQYTRMVITLLRA